MSNDTHGDLDAILSSPDALLGDLSGRSASEVTESSTNPPHFPFSNSCWNTGM